MKKLTFAIMGLGNRGTVYAKALQDFKEKAQIVAIADPRRSCLDAANEYLQLPETGLYDSADHLLSQPKLADVMIVATQDAMHREHAIRSMEQGYDLLLEKPISTNPKEVREIKAVADRLGRRVILAHVLRYTVFYRKIKQLLDQGAIGRVLNLEAAEHVSCHHMAHAYVRGHWRRKEDSSPIILAKCSHDLDLIYWLTGKHCKAISSVGSLDFFTKENMPQGAPERCADGCPAAETCPYHAQNFYLSHIPGWPTKNMHPTPTEENIREILDTTRYGVCVFRQDNDVVDHQQVQMLLEDNVTVSFSLNGFHTRGTRTIRINGTTGELWGDLNAKELYLQPHGGEITKIEIDALDTGHAGGDEGLVEDMVAYFRNEPCSNSISTLDQSVESHYVAFAAEESRMQGGKQIRLS